MEVARRTDSEARGVMVRVKMKARGRRDLVGGNILYVMSVEEQHNKVVHTQKNRLVHCFVDIYSVPYICTSEVQSFHGTAQRPTDC